MKGWPDLHWSNQCVLRYHIFKCAPGTTNVQCPWHLQCSVLLALLEFSAPGTITKFTVQYSSSAQVDTGTTSLDRLPVHLRMKLELPSLLWGSSWSPHSPRNWVDCGKTGHSVPWWKLARVLHYWCMQWYCALPDVVHYCKCHMLASVLLWKEIIFCTTPAVGHQPADMC